MAANVKSKTPIYAKVINPKTKRSRKGLYKIKPEPKGTRIIRTEPDRKKKPKSGGDELPLVFSNSSCDKIFCGKGGEFAVVSELLFRGYNASIMSADEGVDITASKGDKFFFIQVKTSFSKKTSFLFSLNRTILSTALPLIYSM